MPAEILDPNQLWVRDRSSRVWGPLSLATIELMVDHGVVTKPFQYSNDGVTFQLAPDDMLVGGGILPAAIAPPVLSAGPAAVPGTSAMKAALAAGRAQATPRPPGSLPPAAPRAPGAGLPPSAQRGPGGLPPRAG
ncbi:MAG TPA: hypothetical protein VMB50_05145, partial [Myxococcales bacterium]|nr:hypothetical protein [Myxococcales bacterium]